MVLKIKYYHSYDYCATLAQTKLILHSKTRHFCRVNFFLFSQVRRGINMIAVNPYLKVKVGSGTPTGGTDFTYGLIHFYIISCFD